VSIGFEEVNENSGEATEVGSLISRECGLGAGREFKLTKRKILSAGHRIFDPLGICSPVLLVPKLILQSLWKENKGWDEEVSETVAKRFYKWSKDLHKLKELEIPRWILHSIDGKKSLYVFTDAR